MVRWFVETSMKHRRAVLAIALVLAVAGGWQLRNVKRDVAPEFTPPTVEVQTEALGLSAEEVEQLLTVPLERDFLNGIPYLEDIRSTSVPSLSSVVLTFEEGTDLFTARQLVQERLSLTSELPNVSKPPQMLPAEASASRVEMISLRSTTVSPIDLSVLAQFTVKPKLLGVRGVANVSIFGQRNLQLQVQVDPAKLAATGITLDQVISTTGNALFVSPLPYLEASTPGSGGFFDTASQRFGVQHDLPIKGPDDLAKVAIEDGGANVHLSDVATVVEDHQALIGDASVADGPGLLLVIQRLPDANTSDVTAGVDEALDQLRPGLGGVTVDTGIYRPARYVHDAVRNLARTAAVALLVGLLVLALLLFDPRALLASVITAPVAVVAAAYVLYLRGTTITSMELAGLVAGSAIVIHDVVALTTLVSRTTARDDDVGDQVQGTGVALLAATVVAGLALVPVLFLTGLPSRPFVPAVAGSLALAVVAGVLASLVVAPAAAGLVTRRPLRHEAGRPRRSAGLIGRACAGIARPTAAHPGVALGALALVLLAVGVPSAIGSHPHLQPEFNETDLVVQWTAVAGTALPEMDRIVTRAGAELRTVAGVRDVGSHVGRAISSDQVVSSSSAETWVSIDPKADHAKVVRRVQRVIDGYPGLDHQLRSYVDTQELGIAGRPKAPIIVRVSGQDLSVLQAKSTEIVGRLASVRGVKRPAVAIVPQAPTIQVAVDLAKADAYGVKPGDVRRAATTLVSGLSVGSLYQDQKVFDVVVRGLPGLSTSLTSVQDLGIGRPGGGQLRLRDVASVQIAPSLGAVTHANVSRSLDVTADVSGRDVASVVRDVRAAVAGVTFPPEHTAVVLSDTSARRSAQLRVAVVALLALVLSYLALQALFESWALALAVVGSLPFALVGGLAAVALTDRRLSIGSLAGLFVVGALFVRGATIVLRRAQEQAAASPSAPRATAAVQAFADATPSTVAALVAIAAATVPFIALGAAPGGEIVRPMAVVVLGGLLSAVVVLLAGLPAAFAAVGQGIASSTTVDLRTAATPAPAGGAAVAHAPTGNGHRTGNGNGNGTGTGNGNGHVHVGNGHAPIPTAAADPAAGDVRSPSPAPPPTPPPELAPSAATTAPASQEQSHRES